MFLGVSRHSSPTLTTPSYFVLLMLVLVPYLLYVVRHRPLLVLVSLALYSSVVLPIALNQQMIIENRSSVSHRIIRSWLEFGMKMVVGLLLLRYFLIAKPLIFLHSVGLSSLPFFFFLFNSILKLNNLEASNSQYDKINFQINLYIFSMQN